MKSISFISSLLCLSIVALLTSCKPGIPNEYIQRGDLEDILYDYHLAQAMLANSPTDNTPENQQLYKLATLQKHGVTEQQFDQSMAYYMRHADNLHNIYENLATRFERSALEHGITVSNINQYGTNVAKGDTADIWTGERTIMLTNKLPFHLRSFTIKADTTYRPGDKLMLNFNAQFILQEGSRDAIAMLAIRYANDSIASQMQRISSNTHYTLQLSDNNRLGIKSISGYFICNKTPSEHSTTLKLLSLTNIQLIRMHTKDAPKVKEDDSTDSLTDERVPNTAPISPDRISMGLTRMKK